MKDAVNSFSTSVGDVFVDKNGIVTVFITNPDQGIETLKKHYVEYEKIMGTERRKVILVFTVNSIFLPAESRTYSQEKLNQLTCTLAGVITKPMIRIFVNIFVKMNRLESNLNVFKDIESAKKWILEA